ncbi:abortive infection family protein [Oscillatoria amoena NRMC-F 0135]|nr:abortive infection family protein [Oscillatoria amoena NRMC-F 0135]
MSTASTKGLTPGQINRLVYKYIGVNGGYLGDFSYNSHSQFYAELDLPISPKDMFGTTRERFMNILETADPSTQAKIVEGILEKYPAASSDIRSQALHDEIRSWIPKLRASGGVLSPILARPSEVVERALSDAEFLIANSGAVSGIDRLHTALHGYLKQACSDAAILPVDRDPDLTKLLKQIREHHPKFKARGARADDIASLQNALASIVSVLNPIRNRASVAHPNDALLDAAEAHLVINCVRTLLHYLEAKLGR